MSIKYQKRVIHVTWLLLVIFLGTFVHYFGLGSKSFKPVIIVSDSMEPTIMTGALIMVKYTDSVEDIDVDDIIMFYAPTLHGYNTHRVIEKGQDFLRTRGDNTSAPDYGSVISDALVGKVVFIWNGAAKYTPFFIHDGTYDRAAAVAVLLMSALFLGILIFILCIICRWLYAAIRVLTGTAFTPKLYRELQEDIETAQRMAKGPTNPSLLWRIRMFDTYRIYHREMSEFKYFLDKGE